MKIQKTAMVKPTDSRGGGNDKELIKRPFMKLTKQNRIVITLVITLLVWGHILWDHLHGGIPTHYLFHSKDMPGIPNWVGAIILPFFSWFLLSRIQKRMEIPESKDDLKIVVYRFVLALIVAITISVLFVFEVDAVDYIMLIIITLSFVFPLYKSEYLLGWVLGSAFTFGAMIPMGFGSILAGIFFLFYSIRKLLMQLFK